MCVIGALSLVYDTRLKNYITKSLSEIQIKKRNYIIKTVLPELTANHHLCKMNFVI